VFQQAACGARSARVNGLAAFLNVLDHPVFIHHEGGAIGKAVLFIQNPVLFGNVSLKIAEEGESKAFLLGEGAVSRRTIDADSQDLRAVLLELGNISLICL